MFRTMVKLKSKWRWLVFLIAVLCIGVLVGCNTDDGDDDDDDDSSSGQWTLISLYHFTYNSEDQLTREVDDNNANNQVDSGDETWHYSYDGDGLRTGYLKYSGSDLDADGIGTYFHDGNDCIYRLEEVSPSGSNLKVWKYDVDADCRRNSYTYEGDDTSETGTYSYNQDGYVTRLSLDTGPYWDYTLDDDGDRLRYDYYDEDGDLYRYGIYYYDYDGRMDQLNNYERR